MKKIIYQVSLITIITNICLSILKLVCGVVGKSKAIISDAIHSMSDVFTTFIVIVSAKIAKEESDDHHPYGHERIECVFSVILAIILALIGFFVGSKAIFCIINNNYNHISIPNSIALIAAIISIITKELMYWYTIKYAKLTNSISLKADAYHHRSDSLSSIGSLIGILAAMLGFPIMDNIASIIICIFIIKTAIDIFLNSMNQMIDTSVDDKTINDIKKTIKSVDGLIQIDLLKTRMFASKIYVDIEISVNKNLTLIDAHNIAEDVHYTLEKTYPNIKHCMVHVNPYMKK